MATIQFAYINRSDSATLSGGSWQPTLPLANLQQENLGLLARSIDAAEASTRIDVDLGASPPLVRLVGFMKYNFTPQATYQVIGGTTPGASDVYDSGVENVWQRIYQYTDLDFEEENWWTGQISNTEAALYPGKLLHDMAGNYSARYWRIQFSDTANADGYVQVGRLWMGPVWSPARQSYSYGATLGWEPRDRAAVSRSGRRYSERNSAARVFEFQLESMGDAEALGRVLDMRRLLGSEGQLLVIPDPDDTAQRHRRDILARIRRHSGVRQTFLDLQQTAFELEEWL